MRRALAAAALGCAGLLAGGCRPPAAETPLRVAVAANFAAPLAEIAEAFERETGVRVEVSRGATGQLYAQIVHGAPFEVFLAADEERPRRLEASGAAVAGSRFTYAVGRLALWSPQAAPVAGPEALAGDGFRHLAIANPRTAPYGAAAVRTLEQLGLWDRLQPRIVVGEDVGQTFQFVASGGAELGFVALSQLATGELGKEGSRWVVPSTLHEPIRQQAVLLESARGRPQAQAFLDFLRGEEARAVLDRFGYGAEG